MRRGLVFPDLVLDETLGVLVQVRMCYCKNASSEPCTCHHDAAHDFQPRAFSSPTMVRKCVGFLRGVPTIHLAPLVESVSMSLWYKCKQKCKQTKNIAPLEKQKLALIAPCGRRIEACKVPLQASSLFNHTAI